MVTKQETVKGLVLISIIELIKTFTIDQPLLQFPYKCHHRFACATNCKNSGLASILGVSYVIPHVPSRVLYLPGIYTHME